MIQELDDLEGVGPAAIAEKLNEVIRAQNAKELEAEEAYSPYYPTGPCQVCGGRLEFYFHRFWGWIFGASHRCVKCGRRWSNDMGPK